MTGKSAARNRIILFFTGLLLTGIGAGFLILGIDTGAEKTWTSIAGTGVDSLKTAAEATPIPGTQTHWIAVAALALAVIAVIVVLSWLVGQRTRYRRTAARFDGASSLGEITVDNRAIEQLIEARLGADPGIIASQVRSVPTGRNGTGVRVRITTRRGASPADVVARANTAADEAQAILGQQIPVLITVRAGARAALGHVQRVS